MYSAFNVIVYLCYFNMTFMLQNLVTFLFTSKLKRFYSFPTITHITDALLLVGSVLFIEWFSSNIQSNLTTNPPLSQEEFDQRLAYNFHQHLDFKFQYLFAVMIGCLILRVAIILQFNESIGPLIKIVGKMSKDFYNFFLLYALLTVMFGIVGNINFLFSVSLFKNFFSSLLSVIDASLGNYDFDVYNIIDDETLKIIGVVYTIMIVVSFNILILNLIIAILANTYNIFDDRSNGLYLSKILMSRDEMLYDTSYGSFLSGMPPINAI